MFQAVRNKEEKKRKIGNERNKLALSQVQVELTRESSQISDL